MNIHRLFILPYRHIVVFYFKVYIVTSSSDSHSGDVVGLYDCYFDSTYFLKLSKIACHPPRCISIGF